MLPLCCALAAPAATGDTGCSAACLPAQAAPALNLKRKAFFESEFSYQSVVLGQDSENEGARGAPCRKRGLRPLEAQQVRWVTACPIGLRSCSLCSFYINGMRGSQAAGSK